jgi:peptidoglycan/LPS O-acetylase OafA/YrhL
MPASTGRENVFVDLVDHNGLRGVAVMWVLMFHCFFFSALHWNFQGSTLMPLFFLLSGFYCRWGTSVALEIVMVQVTSL